MLLVEVSGGGFFGHSIAAIDQLFDSLLFVISIVVVIVLTGNFGDTDVISPFVLAQRRAEKTKISVLKESFFLGQILRLLGRQRLFSFWFEMVHAKCLVSKAESQELILSE